MIVKVSKLLVAPENSKAAQSESDLLSVWNSLGVQFGSYQRRQISVTTTYSINKMRKSNSSNDDFKV